MRDVAPVVPLTYTSEPTLVSKRVGCVLLRPALDLAAACSKSVAQGDWTETQTAPSRTAIPEGALPTSIVFTTSRFAASIRETVPSPAFATQTAACADRQAGRGVAHADLLRRRRRAGVAGSMRVTVSAPVFATQIAPSPAAIAVGRRPTLIGVPSGPSSNVAGSKRCTVALSVLTTQT